MVEKMQFSCNGTSRTSAENYATTKEFNLSNYHSYGCNTEDGEKTIYVRFIDAFGNV
jgi:hypothetical protein